MQICTANSQTKRAPSFPRTLFCNLVEPNGIEPLTSTMPLFRLPGFGLPLPWSTSKVIEADCARIPASRGILRTHFGPKLSLSAARQLVTLKGEPNMAKRLTYAAAGMAVTKALLGTNPNTRQLDALVLAVEALRRASLHPAHVREDGMAWKSDVPANLTQAVDDILTAISLQSSGATTAKDTAILAVIELDRARQCLVNECELHGLVPALRNPPR